MMVFKKFQIFLLISTIILATNSLQSQEVDFSIEPDVINLGEIGLSETHSLTSRIKITNTGELSCEFALQVSCSVPWSPFYSPDIDGFVLRARFDREILPPADFSPSLDMVRQNITWATCGLFAIFGPEGCFLLSGDSLSLWLQFLSPSASSYCDTTTILLTAHAYHDSVVFPPLFISKNISLFLELICEPVYIANKHLSKPNSVVRLGAYPNPFNSGTNITVQCDEPIQTNLYLYNLMGELVRVLDSNSSTPLAVNEYNWNGKDVSGNRLPSGIYWAQISTILDSRKALKIILMN